MVEWILYYASRTRTQVIAWAVMPNHLHIVAVQGDLPLWRFMQPLLRRLAFDVRVRCGRKGHVFERRYGARPMLDAAYVRNAIAYVHLNPVRAGICDSADDFPHSSHHLYCLPLDGRVPSRSEAAVALALQLFGTHRSDSAATCRASYLRFLTWRLATDALTGSRNGDHPFTVREPLFPGGDSNWSEQYGMAVDRFAMHSAARIIGPDISTLALRVLEHELPGASLDWLRSGRRTRLLVRIRRQVIALSLAAGHSNGRIAAFLNVSSSAVSRVNAKQPLPVLPL